MTKLERIVSMTEDEFETLAKNTFDNEFTQELIERIRTRKSILRASTVNQPEYIATWTDLKEIEDYSPLKLGQTKVKVALYNIRSHPAYTPTTKESDE